jgi:mannose-1-phosphate guanylyltransferase
VVSGKVRAVAQFVEKPDQTKAEQYIKAGYL